MKLLFDENLSPALVDRLQDIFSGSVHVHGCGLGSMADHAVWEFAKAGGYFVVTKDSDYNERSVLFGIPPKVIWLRIGNCTTGSVETLLRGNSILIHAFETDSNSVLVLN